MKFLIILLVLAATVYTEGTEEEEKQWQEFKLEHGKLFLSPGKEAKRKETFLKNARDVQKHNQAFLKKDATYAKGINKYSDLTDEEFLARFTGVKAPIATVNETRTVMLRQTVPASLDLRPQAGVGPIRDQSSCGSCWTFAIVAAIEYAYWRRNGMVYDLSEQQLVDCVYARSGCEGGWISDATEYISNNCGLTMENNYPTLILLPGVLATVHLSLNMCICSQVTLFNNTQMMIIPSKTHWLIMAFFPYMSMQLAGHLIPVEFSTLL